MSTRAQSLSAPSWRDARILIVDDQPENIHVLTQVLSRAGYRNVIDTTNSWEAVPLYTSHRPDLILLDLHMPGLDGFGVLKKLRELIAPSSYLPVLVLTGDESPDVRSRALAAGAKDFLTKPFDVTEVLLRIGNLLETRSLYMELQDDKTALEWRVEQRTRELAGAQLEILERLARAAECRDDDTGEHTRRVGQMSSDLAQALGLPPLTVTLIRHAAVLHDIGKIGISDQILLKPGRLTPDEFDVMKTHTTIGANILAGSDVPLLVLAESIALNHHEAWDGTGYPSARRGEETPIDARIVAVADVFDALTHDRPYRRAWLLDTVLMDLLDRKGLQFDPQVVDAFFDLRLASRADIRSESKATAL